MDAQIDPETDLERTIIADQEWWTGAEYGEPRPGHPEGKVVYHIKEVLNNIDRLFSTSSYDPGPSPLYCQLRLIALIHDTFKYKVDRAKPRNGENHHGTIARRFAEKYIKDEAVLEIIELHDEAYNAWRKGNSRGQWDKAEERAKVLIKRLGNRLELYLAFFQCDNETGDKTRDSVIWFKKIANA
jgi:hypothetical protein